MPHVSETTAITIIVTNVLLLLACLLYLARGSLLGLLAMGARLFGWLFFFAALFGVMILIGGPFGVVLWLATVVIALMVVSRYRDGERQMLLWSLGLAVEKGIPLPAAARAFADERGGSIGRRAARLATALEQGMSLDAAIKTARLRLPPAADVAVQTGCETGSLATSLAGASRASAFIETTTRGAASQVIYLAFFVLIAAGVITFLMVKIVPELIKICDGFGMRLPGVTVLAVNLCYMFTTPFTIFVLPLLILALLYAVGRYIGFVRWDLPLMRKMTRRLDEAIVLRSLSTVVEHEHSLPAAMDSLARIYPKRHVRKRLEAAQAMIAQGTNWCDSLQAAGMLRPVETSVLKSAERVDNLPWALQEMADRQVRRFTTRLNTLFGLGFPLVLLIISAVVLLAALVVFAPMTTLIERMQ
jgi:type II secretory pathway component PulF